MNSSKKVERTFRYGPYGENTKSEGTQTIPDPFGYKGGYRMPGGNKGEGNISNSLYHFGARYYDPTTGHWTQQDPEEHLGNATQGNRFLFAGDDPLNFSDSTGTSSEGIAACGVASGVAGAVGSVVGTPVVGAVAGAVTGYACSEAVEPEETSEKE